MGKNSLQYIRNSDYIFRKIADEMILVPIHQDVADLNCIYTLNEVGAFLWEQLAEPIKFEELEKNVLENYDVSKETVKTDLNSFLDDLIAFGAIRKV